MLAFVLALLATPAQHGDFDHYTFALTWQPGICSTDRGCRADQPRTPLIGLHGLWASTPHSLAATGVVDPQWWSRGCDYYQHSDAAPPLDAALTAQLDAVMPHFTYDLLTHEYDKHVQCFGFDPTPFFETELAMRDAVASSSFGSYLVGQAGHLVKHDDVVRQFASDLATSHPTALQLQCAKTSAGEIVLTQFWITIPSGEINAFPKPQSLMDTPTNQDTCPPTFLIPAW
jgi:ribonuclease I (enterobacter ribonuclease)